MSDILDLPIPVQAAKVASGEISAVALTERALQRMAAQAGLHAFLHVSGAAALAAAAAVDKKRQSGASLGKLAAFQSPSKTRSAPRMHRPPARPRS